MEAPVDERDEHVDDREPSRARARAPARARPSTRGYHCRARRAGDRGDCRRSRSPRRGRSGGSSRGERRANWPWAAGLLSCAGRAVGGRAIVSDRRSFAAQVSDGELEAALPAVPSREPQMQLSSPGRRSRSSPVCGCWRRTSDGSSSRAWLGTVRRGLRLVLMRSGHARIERARGRSGATPVRDRRRATRGRPWERLPGPDRRRAFRQRNQGLSPGIADAGLGRSPAESADHPAMVPRRRAKRRSCRSLLHAPRRMREFEELARHAPVLAPSRTLGEGRALAGDASPGGGSPPADRATLERSAL